MHKKWLTLFTLTFFIFFSVSCYTTKITGIEVIKAKMPTRWKVLSLVKKDGEWIVFTRKEPGKIDYASGTIDGLLFDKEEGIRLISVPFSEISRVKVKRLDVGSPLGLLLVVAVATAPWLGFFVVFPLTGCF